MAFRFVQSSLLSIALLLLPYCGLAQTPQLEVIGSDQGLSQGMVYDILQDQTGFLWFSTRDGLNRYDGYNFRVYKNDPFNAFSISDNVIRVLFEDHLGRIWVGTETNGVDVLDPVTGRFYHLNTGANGLSNPSINTIAETPDGAVWIGTQNGLNRVVLPDQLPVSDPDLRSIAVVHSSIWETTDGSAIRTNVFQSLLYDKQGTMWVGTARDAYRFNPFTGEKVVLMVQEQLGRTFNLKSNFFGQAPDGTIWLGQYTRIVRIDKNGFTFLPMPEATSSYVSYLSFDSQGGMCVSKRKAIYKFEKTDLQQIDHGVLPVARLFCSFPQKDVIGSTDILTDRNGLMWIGTNGYGIRKYNPVNQLFKHYLPGVSTRKIREDASGELWVWTSAGMFFRLNQSSNTTAEPVLHDSGLFVQDCLFSKDGTLWVLAQYRSGSADNSVLIRRNLATGVELRYPDLLSASMYTQLMEDSQGIIWALGARSDLLRFDPKTNLHKVFDLSVVTGYKECGFVMTEDVFGHYWIGTPHGLVRGIPGKNPQDLKFSLLINNPANRSSLSNNVILSVCDDVKQPRELLWIGTRGGGLNRLNKSTGDCQHFTAADGLPNEVVYGILPDPHGNYWLSTNSGLSKFSPDTRFFENYSVADGLQDNEFNTVSYTACQDGFMAFGGVNGITLFHPQRINPDKRPPPLFITALKIQNKAALPGGGILTRVIERTSRVVLPFHQNHVTLEFAALDYATPHKNQFRYRLLGAHDEWSEATTEHSTTYSNLPPGVYTFEVKTGGARGIWEAPPIQLVIEVLAPWWRTKTAYLAYAMILVGLLWYLYRTQIRRIQLQEQLAFEHREAERIRSIEQLKSNFFSNITHELRTPITLILEPLRQVLRQPEAENWLAKVRLAESNSQKLLHLINQLLDLAKLEGGAMQPEYRRGQIADLLRAVGETFENKAAGKNIALEIQTPETALQPFDFDPDKVEKIVTNLLSNALKFTPPGGTVTLHWSQQSAQWLLVDITDTGSGIAPEDLPRVFDRFFSKVPAAQQQQTSTGIGLALCRELAELMGGRMEVTSTPEVKTTFRLWLPIREQQVVNIAQHPPFVAGKMTDDSNGAFTAPDLNPAHPGGAAPLLLLAEDNEELRRFVAQTLSEKYTVLQAVDGQDAVAMAIQHVPDVVVSDLMMPRMDGFGLLDTLKNDVRTSHIPVLLLTAKTAVESRIEGLQHGADAYLGKPFQTIELFAWIDNLLESRRRLQVKFSGASPMASPAIEAPAAAMPSAAAVLGVLDQQFLDNLRALAEKEMDNDRLTPDELARALHMSRSQLHRKLTALTGMSVTEYLRNYRLDKALELLQSGVGNVQEVAYQVGFINAKHFSTSFKERFGKSPSEV